MNKQYSSQRKTAIYKEYICTLFGFERKKPAVSGLLLSLKNELLELACHAYRYTNDPAVLIALDHLISWI